MSSKRFHVTNLPVYIRVVSLAMKRSYECPRANEVTLEEKCQYDTFLNKKGHTKAGKHLHNKMTPDIFP